MIWCAVRHVENHYAPVNLALSVEAPLIIGNEIPELKTPLVNYFIPEPPELLKQWDGEIKFSGIKGKLDYKKLLEPIPCGNGWIPLPFEWDGSSSPRLLYPLIPKWRHPVFSARHDFRCRLIRQMRSEGMSWREGMKLRKIADQLGREDIMIGQKRQWVGELEGFIAYIGVRIGAYTGIGMRS